MKCPPRMVLGVPCLGLLLAFSGCSAVTPFAKDANLQSPNGASAPPEATKGTVEFNATPQQLSQALPEALADLQMEYIRTKKDGGVIQVDAKSHDRRTVHVTIRPGLAGKARFNSRIGWFGDTLLSQALAERVGIRAGLLAPKPIPEQPPSSPDPNPIFSRSAVSDEEMYRDMAEAPYRDRTVP